MHLDSAVRDCRVFVKQWSSAAHSLGYLLQYSKKLSTSSTNLLHAVQHAWSLRNSYRPPDTLLKQLQRYAWLPSMCEAAMSLKDCCSRQQYQASGADQHSDAMEHADTAILALGSLLLAVLRWCNLSQLMHTAQQHCAPKAAAMFRELFEQVWCHAGVFLLGNYTAVLVALVHQEVKAKQQQMRARVGCRQPPRQLHQGKGSPSLPPGSSAALKQQQQQQQQLLSEHMQTLSLDMLQPPSPKQQPQPGQAPAAAVSEHHRQGTMPPDPQQQQQQPKQSPTTSPAKLHRPSSTTPPARRRRQQQQAHDLPVQQLSLPSVWHSVHLPEAHQVWGPPSDPSIWHRRAYGITHSAAAELQLVLMLWGWAIRMAPTLGLQHHASADVLLLLLETAWLLDVCPAAAWHQKRGLCLWSTPSLMLRLLLQPLLPAEDDQEESAAAAAAAAGGGGDMGGGDSRRKAVAAEQLPAQPQECSRMCLQLTQSLVEQLTKEAMAEEEHRRELARLNVLYQDSGPDGSVARMNLCRYMQYYDQGRAQELDIIMRQLAETFARAARLMAAAANITQPFTAKEMQLICQQLCLCSEQAGDLGPQHLSLLLPAISDMEATSNALQQRLEQQKADVLRILQHPSLAGRLLQLPLQLLQHLQPLTDEQLKQAAVQLSRLDDTVRRLVELPTMLLQAEQGLHADLQDKQQQQQQQQQQQPQHARLQQQQQQQGGVWQQHTLQLLQLAEVYIRCQHLSRVVGLESGQLLAAVVPKSEQQLLHVLHDRQLVAGLAALVITRCKALNVLLAETLELQRHADSSAAAPPAPDTTWEEIFPAAWTQCSSSADRQAEQASCEQAKGSRESSSSSSNEVRNGAQPNRLGAAAGDECDEENDSSLSDGSSVSIHSWCSSSSSILCLADQRLPEVHLAIGSMAVHMLEQAVTWLDIVALWQACPDQHKANCQLSTEATAKGITCAADQPPRMQEPVLAPVQVCCCADLMADSSSSSSAVRCSAGSTASASLHGADQASPATHNTAAAPGTAPAAGGTDSIADTAAGGAASSDATVAENSSGAAAAAVGAVEPLTAAGSGAAVIDALAFSILPMACCMIQHSAHALQLLLPVWQRIAPGPDVNTYTAAAARVAAEDSSENCSSDPEQHTDSDESYSEDEALPSLKTIATWHQSAANKALLSTTGAVWIVLPSIMAALQQQQQQRSLGLETLDQAFMDAVHELKLSVGTNDAVLCHARGTDTADAADAGTSLWLSEHKDGGTPPEKIHTAALCMLCALPFAFREVLQAAAAANAAENATGTLAPAAAAVAGGGPGAAAPGSYCGASSPSSSSSSSYATPVQAAAVDDVQSTTGCSTSAAAPARCSGDSPSSSRCRTPPSCGKMPQARPRNNSDNSSIRYWGCNNAQCGNLSGASELCMPVYGCSACRSAGYACTYCSSACQQMDWPVHKLVCKARRRWSGNKH